MKQEFEIINWIVIIGVKTQHIFVPSVDFGLGATELFERKRK